MPAVVVQYVSKPKPGSDLQTIMQISKEAAALWRKHGGDVSYWNVIGGEVGNLVFVVRFDSFESYGRTMNAMFGDPAEGRASGMGARQYCNRTRTLIEFAFANRRSPANVGRPFQFRRTALTGVSLFLETLNAAPPILSIWRSARRGRRWSQGSRSASQGGARSSR
jgi:hypothetical protein